MTGEDMHVLMDRLWPIPRSVAGPGLRQTLQILSEYIPLKLTEVPSGSKVYDWVVPDEWEFKRAQLEGPIVYCSTGAVPEQPPNRVSLSYPDGIWPLWHCKGFDGYQLSLDELLGLTYVSERMPHAIPYVTSYYERRIGVCMSQITRDNLQPGQYRLIIDAKLYPGSMTFGEALIPGREQKEVFLTTYCCHPRMANNELSGPVVMAALARWIMSEPRRLTYRIFIGPETIGPIAYLATKGRPKNVIAGYVLTCLGGDGNFSLQHGRKYSDTLATRAADKAIRRYPADHQWEMRASDERQWCAPCVDLPMCSITKTRYDEYDEYHTNLDNLEFVKPEHLQASLEVYKRCIETLEADGYYLTQTIGEPMMSKYGLYPTLSYRGSSKVAKKYMDIISYCDGETSLLQISEELEIPMPELLTFVNTLQDKGVIKRVSDYGLERTRRD